jgi:hypothetical protein
MWVIHMRFEIGSGGGFVILVGLLVLSGAVFFLGIISGRRMVQSQRDQSQIVSIYPIPTGGPSVPPPQSAKSPAAVTVAMPGPSSLPAVAFENMPSASPPNPSRAYVRLSHPTNAPTINRSIRTSHLGYKIMIEATMDGAAADRMTARLLGLGYTSRIVPSQINGQTWYAVQVGPYPTEDAALAAEANLRAAYNARYIDSRGAPSPATTGTAGASQTNSDGSSGSNSAPSARTD